MTDEELDEALVELAETRETAERELEALQGRHKVVEELERDRDAFWSPTPGWCPSGWTS